MKNIRDIVGRESEAEACRILNERGWWVHRFEKGKNGQPCDIISIKNDISVLFDVKHVKGTRFCLGRVESNQITSLGYAKRRGVTRLGFAIKYEVGDKVFWKWKPYDEVYELLKKGEASVKFDETSDFIEVFSGFLGEKK